MKILGPYQTIIYKSQYNDQWHSAISLRFLSVHRRQPLDNSYTIEHIGYIGEDFGPKYFVIHNGLKYKYNTLSQAKTLLDKILLSTGYDILSDNEFEQYKLLY
jgi:hypothetical protein